MRAKSLTHLGILCVGVVISLSSVGVRADIADLTATDVAYTFANGGVFQRYGFQASGSGVFDSFVRIGDSKSATSGYNTDGTLEFDTMNGTHTHSIRLSEVPTVVLNGVTYREFLLDSNEPAAANKKYISLDTFQIFTAGVGDLTGYPGGLGTLVYDLDSGGSDNWIKVDSSFSTGSGSSDIRALIADSLFTGNPYVYLYSTFGANESGDAGFEEWGVRRGTSAAPVVPAPGAVLLGVLGLGLVSRIRRHFA